VMELCHSCCSQTDKYCVLGARASSLLGIICIMYILYDYKWYKKEMWSINRCEVP
jgi:hypothetical protein